MAVSTVMGSATRITFITEKDSVSDTSRPTMIPPSSCPHSAIKWHSSGTTDTQLTCKEKRNKTSIWSFILCMWSLILCTITIIYSPNPWTPFSTVETIWRIWRRVSTMASWSDLQITIILDKIQISLTCFITMQISKANENTLIYLWHVNKFYCHNQSDEGSKEKTTCQ